MSLAIRMYRKGCKKNDDKRDAGLTTPEDIFRQDNIVYGTDKKNHVLDVYRPKSAKGKLPVIVSVHGGGWVYGDKELYQWYCMSLAQRGFAVVNFTYRLAPKFKYPAGMLDTNAVFEWIMNNATEYNFDTEHIFAVGDSAGAHMLSTYCDMLINPEYAKTYGARIPQELKIKAVALNCGCYDMVVGAKEIPSTSFLTKNILPHKGTAEELDWISPALHATKDFPPSFIMTANDDFLKSQAPIMEAKLKELGVTCELHLYGTEEIKLGHVFHVDVKSEQGQKCNDEECAFFRKYIDNESLANSSGL